MGSALDFNNETTWNYQLQGRKDGLDAVNKGEGFVFNHMDKWVASDELKQQYPQLGDYIK